MPTSPRLSKTLLDSAVVIAVFGGAAFALGHNLEMADATAIGLPPELLPNHDVQTTVYIGGVFLLQIGMSAVIAYCILWWAGRVVRATWRDGVVSYFRSRYNSNPPFVTTAGVLGAIAIAIVAARIDPFQHALRSKKHWQRVTQLESEIAAISSIDLSDTRLVTVNADSYVLFDKAEERFIVVPRDKVSVLSIVDARTQLRSSDSPKMKAVTPGHKQRRKMASEPNRA